MSTMRFKSYGLSTRYLHQIINILTWNAFYVKYAKASTVEVDNKIGLLSHVNIFLSHIWCRWFSGHTTCTNRGVLSEKVVDYCFQSAEMYVSAFF